MMISGKSRFERINARETGQGPPLGLTGDLLDSARKPVRASVVHRVISQSFRTQIDEIRW
ncbi:hypothetical protein [Sphingomonas sp. NFX23]|uniref:hypothetical protein n=1 Tax=Sphingomonas sp. NFX23 TaxID=2819532 RepID=UPI003CEBDDD7